MHRADTSQNKGIKNSQDCDVSSEGALAYFADLARRMGLKPRTKPSGLYNCHGLTFASRRTKITQSISIRQILAEDKYQEIPEAKAEAGDVVVYFDNEGDPNHSGVVVSSPDMQILPTIVSKWGFAPEFIHASNNVPPQYGPIKKYYRCRL